MVRMSYPVIAGDGFQFTVKALHPLVTAAYIELKHKEDGALSQAETIGSYLHTNFDAAFPTGAIGCTYTLDHVGTGGNDFLPQGGGPVALTTNYIDPTDPLVSTLSGNLLA